MIISTRVRAALAVAAMAALLVGCETPEPPPAPPPPPPPPPVALAPSVIEEASAYRSYMAQATAISPNFTDGPSIASALRVSAAYEPKQFTRGAVAYGAIVALQDPTFVAELRTFAKDAAQRREIANRLVANPAYVIELKGSDTAAGLVTRALRGDSTRLFTTGRAVKQSAYDIQRQAWSKQHVVDQPGRLSEARTLSTVARQADLLDTALLTQVSTGSARLPIAEGAVAPPYTPLVIRALALGALGALGEATEENAAQIDSLLNDPTTGGCLNMAKLNLYQCLAVAKPHYEDVFCLGQHILMDTGQCLMKGSGAPMPLQIATEPLALPPPTGKVSYVAPKAVSATKKKK